MHMEPIARDEMRAYWTYVSCADHERGVRVEQAKAAIADQERVI